MAEQMEIPVQPVSKPILCNPFVKPTKHWVYDTATGDARQEMGRRSAGYWYKTQRTGSAQLQLAGFAEEQRDDLPLVNLLRDDVERWRDAQYEGATPITKQLLAFWSRPDRSRRLFFCQREAVETVIYLNEILAAGRRPRWNPKLSIDDFHRLIKDERPSFLGDAKNAVIPTLLDQPNEAGLKALLRYGCKMATGSGKTVVMAMLIAWAFCNRGRVPGDSRFPNAVAVVCPNFTINERLQVLRPEISENYYAEFEIVPTQLMPELMKGKVLLTNWHLFLPESEHHEGGKSYTVVNTLAAQWKERFDYAKTAKPGEEFTPPVMIIVTDNTQIAEVFFKNISGEEVVEVVEDDLDDEDEEEEAPRRRKKAKTKSVYGQSKVFPEFANREGFKPTLRIDSKLLAEAESEDPKGSRKEAARALREIVGTVGKPGKPGEQVRCVVSVQMLTEGWDANNVTHILGLRAFDTQLLCEQVVGRGLRRIDYNVDPETGLLTEEYVDIYGVPFSIIPFKGRGTESKAPEDKPKNHVHTDPARAHYEIRFPVVEGYAFALKQNLVRADIDKMQGLVLDPVRTPTAVFVKPQVGYQVGHPGMGGGFQTATQDREAYYRTVHLQTIKFEIARLVTGALIEGIENRTPKYLFS